VIDSVPALRFSSSLVLATTTYRDSLPGARTQALLLSVELGHHAGHSLWMQTSTLQAMRPEAYTGAINSTGKSPQGVEQSMT